MNRQQVIILWIGLALTLVYLFTDKTMHDALFTTGSQAGTVNDVNFATSQQQEQASLV